jgi:D-arabinose 1-dehydrogenase-like Zn-dependent alcohol dehydrogenase
MTVSPKMPFIMQAVLKNIDVRGSTMGSRKEFKEMVDFVKTQKMTPVVSRVVKGIDNMQGIDSLFGKLVVEIGTGSESRL